jgi:hypothetical protein
MEKNKDDYLNQHKIDLEQRIKIIADDDPEKQKKT